MSYPAVILNIHPIDWCMCCLFFMNLTCEMTVFYILLVVIT